MSMTHTEVVLQEEEDIQSLTGTDPVTTTMTSNGDLSNYTCTLSSDVIEQAKTELNEDPATRHIEIKNLKSRLEKYPGLQPRTDVKFLLRFLRARKFDQEKTFELVKNYYKTRQQYPEIFDDIKPSRVRSVLENGSIEFPGSTDNNGCAIIIFRPGLWDFDQVTYIDIVRALYLLLSKVMEDENFQVKGVQFLDILTGFTMKHASHVTPSFVKSFMQVLQDVLPLRLKSFVFFKEPAFFDLVFSLMKPFIKEKLTKRFVFNGPKVEKLHAIIDRKSLPTDFGGELPILGNKAWLDDLFASDAQFEEENKFGFVQMNVNKGKSVSKSGDADMQGLGGTFKKLNI
uniref:CRAL-TRIO domain-containing protein n=2 Tax=Arion vulgaris TaxID=1028688 RepID=A0A0B7B1Q6_9EUPU